MAKEELKTKENNEETLICCLRKERVIVRFLPKESGMITNPKHVLYGGLADMAFRDFVVPRLASSGSYVNVLTNSEKKYLENVMGLEENALSIHKREFNFWDDFKVRLMKDDTVLDLSVPIDYIKYKVLLANPSVVAKSLSELEEHPLATYQFVMIYENEEDNRNMKKLNAHMEAYMLLGQYRHDINTLRVILETLEGRPVSERAKLESILTKLQDLIVANAKTFVSVAKDELLPTKVLMKQCMTKKLITRKGDFYYLAADNTPLCEENGEPTFKSAAIYLNNPKNQKLLYSLQEKVKA